MVRLLVAALIAVFVANSPGLTGEVQASAVTSVPSTATIRAQAGEGWVQAAIAGAAAGAVAGAARGTIGLPDGVAAGAAIGFVGGLLGGLATYYVISSFQQAAGAGGCSGGGDPGGCDLAPRLPENALDAR